MNMQFFVDVLEMPFHGRHGDAQTVSDGFVAQTVHHEFQNFALPVGKILRLGGGGGLLENARGIGGGSERDADAVEQE